MSIDIPTQTCSHCKASLPISEFYRNAKRCKLCQQEATRKWRAKNPDYFENYRKANRAECIKRTLRWRAKNPERHRANLVRFWKTNKEQLRERKARYRAEHATELKDYFQMRVATGLKAAESRRWRALNKPKRAANERRRQARKLNATPHWSERKQIQQLYLGAEYLSQLTGIQWDVDHIVPLRGVNVVGLHVFANLQLLPHIENVRKSNKWAYA